MTVYYYYTIIHTNTHMSESLSAEMPKVSDTIPQPTPGETPEEFKARLSNDPHYAMLKKMAEGTYRDEPPASDKPAVESEDPDDQAA